MKVLFVGTGLIGGSFSLAMKQKGLLSEGAGFSRNSANLDRSIELGIIDRKFENLEEGIEWTDWIILSVPVDAIGRMLPELLDKLRDNQVVIDFGSTKKKICDAVKTHPKRKQFIAAHPVAGTEYSGPDAAFAELFNEKLMIFCDREDSDPQAIGKLENICDEIGMQLEYMSSGSHDTHFAYISHLSHVTSFALSNAILEKEKDGDILLELAGSGFASTVRLAKSSPEMWTPIFLENKEKVLEAVKKYSEKVDIFRKMLENDDREGLNRFLEEGRGIKRVIK